MGKIFISYRRDDSADASGRIYDRLAPKYGPDNVFKDVDAIPLGVDFRRVLTEEVAKCDVMLVIIGRQWANISDDHGRRRLDNTSDFARIEVEAALARDIPVVPVLVQNAPMPQAGDLPSSLAGLAYRNGIIIHGDPHFHRDIDLLIGRLDALFSTLKALGLTPPLPPRNTSAPPLAGMTGTPASNEEQGVNILQMPRFVATRPRGEGDVRKASSSPPLRPMNEPSPVYVQAVNDAFAELSGNGKRVTQKEWIARVAEKLNVDESSAKAIFTRVRESQKTALPPANTPDVMEFDGGMTGTTGPRPAVRKASSSPLLRAMNEPSPVYVQAVHDAFTELSVNGGRVTQEEWIARVAEKLNLNESTAEMIFNRVRESQKTALPPAYTPNVMEFDGGMTGTTGPRPAVRRIAEPSGLLRAMNEPSPVYVRAVDEAHAELSANGKRITQKEWIARVAEKLNVDESSAKTIFNRVRDLQKTRRP
jgi:hypothetical protein